MGFIDSTVKELRKDEKALGLIDGRVVPGMTDTFDEGRPAYNTLLNEELYKKLIWVYICISKNADNIARIPKKVFQIKDNDPENKIDITDHPDLAVLKKPNPFQTENDFWNESVIRLLLQGELFWEKARGTGDKIQQLYADWRTEEVKIIPDPQRMIKGYIRNVNNKEIPYLPEDVFFMKFLDPTNTLRGLPQLQPGRDASILDLDAIAFNKKVFKEGFSAKGIIDAPNLKNETDARRMQERFKKLYTGLAGDSVAVTWGSAKFTTINSTSMQDAQFIDLRKMNRQEIASLFGVPPAILGLFETAIKANAQEQLKFYWLGTLIPLLNKILSTINVFLLPELLVIPGSKIVMEADFKDVEALRVDIDSKSKRYNDGWTKGAVTPNDIRVDIMGKEAINSPEMNTTYLPFGVVPAGKHEEAVIPEPKAIEDKRFQTRISVEKRDSIWKQLIAIQEPFEEPFTKLMKKLFKAQRKETLQIIKDNFNKSIHEKGKFEIEGLVIDDKWFDIFAESSESLFKKTLFAGVSIVDSISEADLIPVLSPIVEIEAGNLINMFSTDINKTTRDAIIKELRAGLAADESLAEISARINRVFDIASESRSALIARTESMNAINLGQLKAGQESEFPNKMWLTSRDGKVRDSHQIDGEVVGKNETFSNGFMYPNDFNERCTMIMTSEEKTI